MGFECERVETQSIPFINMTYRRNIWSLSNAC